MSVNGQLAAYLANMDSKTAVANAHLLRDDWTEETAVCKTIPMPAFGKARPRVTRNGTFMPRDYRRRKAQLKQLFGPVPAGLVHLSVTAVRRMPQSWSQARRERMRGTYAKPKPDVDNIVGAVMDALFVDDDVVVSIFARKVWGDDSQMVIEVASINLAK